MSDQTPQPTESSPPSLGSFIIGVLVLSIFGYIAVEYYSDNNIVLIGYTIWLLIFILINIQLIINIFLGALCLWILITFLPEMLPAIDEKINDIIKVISPYASVLIAALFSSFSNDD